MSKPTIVSQDEEENFEETPEQIRKIKNEYFADNMDKYIDAFAQPQETITTHIVPLTFSQAKEMIAKQIPQQVLQQVQNIMTTYEKQGCLVKLSSRSPKDVTATHAKALAYYAKHVQEEKAATQELEQNRRICIWYEAAMQAMKCYSAQEAFELLLASERVQFDLKLDVRFPEEFSSAIIVRPWLPGMQLQSEFRGFVYQNQLVALSQYFTQCYFATLAEEMPQIVQLVTAFFTSIVQPKLVELQDYVVDFVVVDKQVLLLEVNPYKETTGSGLFDWQQDAAQLHGKLPFQYRILHAPVVHKLKGNVPKIWEKCIFE